MRLLPLRVWLFAYAGVAAAQNPPGPDVAPFVSLNVPVFALEHVRVIDGTGAAAREDQTIVVRDGRIEGTGPAGSVAVPKEAQPIERGGYTVIPGLLGMHDHLYYTDSYALQVHDGRLQEPGLVVAETAYAGPRLYLAAGVTTMRTTGSVEPYADLKVKSRIDANLMPGPAIDATAPYLAAALMTVAVGWSSDRRNERRWHIAGCLALAAVGFAWTAWAHSLIVALCAMTLAAVGLWSMMGPFWTLMTSMLSGTAAAGAVAVLQMAGGVGGFSGPYMMGRLRDTTHGFTAGLYLISGMALVAAMLALVVRGQKRLNPS